MLQLIDDFVAAAVRSERAGFDGVEIHAAHSQMLGEFLSPAFNRRTDEYGGSFDNRTRLFRELLADTLEAVGDRCAVAVAGPYPSAGDGAEEA